MFIRHPAGTATVVDVKNPLQMDDPKVVRQRHRTAALLSSLGWNYRMVGQPPPVEWSNIAYLRHYARPFPRRPEVVEQIHRLASSPITIRACAEATAVPEESLAVIKSMCWWHELELDISNVIDQYTLVRSRRSAP
jgi:hypothetical protein